MGQTKMVVTGIQLHRPLKADGAGRTGLEDADHHSLRLAAMKQNLNPHRQKPPVSEGDSPETPDKCKWLAVK